MRTGVAIQTSNYDWDNVKRLEPGWHYFMFFIVLPSYFLGVGVDCAENAGENLKR